MGVRDYVGKNRFPGVLLGLSGGIDSALTLAVAVDALGPRSGARGDAAVALQRARSASRMRATMAGIAGRALRRDSDRADVRGRSSRRLRASSRDLPPDAAEENIQARIRGTLLMALSNKFGSIVLTTGNKSEMAVGYATLYGDMAGGFARAEGHQQDAGLPAVRATATALGRVIPERIITRAPSAELRADQTDQDSLPPYDVLDAILEAYVEQDRSPAEIVALGYRARRRAQGGAPDQDQRVQAAAGGGRHPHHAARLRQGLALPDHVGVGRLGRHRRPDAAADAAVSVPAAIV